LSGDTFDFASLKGKMIVNTASKCGSHTIQDLEILTKNTKTKVCNCGFSAKQFYVSEPGTNEIATFLCAVLLFPMMDKVSVKADDMCPIYQFCQNRRMDYKTRK
jgi:glutathione peroxidase